MLKRQHFNNIISYVPADPKGWIKTIQLFWVLTILTPIVTIASTHLWLRTAYSGNLFHVQGFINQYDHGIYRYRILGRDGVLGIYRLLSKFFHDSPLSMPRDPAATTLFYASYVLMDGICFSLSNFFLLLLLSDKQRRISDPHLANYFFLTLIQALAMYVATPYDQLSYLLILVSLWTTTLSNRRIAWMLLITCAIAGAFNRESQALVTCVLLAEAIFSSDDKYRRRLNAGIVNLVCFIAVYALLRLCIPGPASISAGVSYGGKWALSGALVLTAIFCIGTALGLRMYRDIRPAIALVLLCAPYLITIATSGSLREMRLIVPMLLSQALLYASLARNSFPPKVLTCLDTE